MNSLIIGYSPEIVLSNRCQLVCPQASPDAKPKIIDTPISIALCPAHSFSFSSLISLSLSLSLFLCSSLSFSSLFLSAHLSQLCENCCCSHSSLDRCTVRTFPQWVPKVFAYKINIALPIPRCSTINSFYFIPISDSLTAKFASNHKEQTSKSSKILFVVCNKYYRYIPKILQICRNTYISMHAI